MTRWKIHVSKKYVVEGKELDPKMYKIIFPSEIVDKIVNHFNDPSENLSGFEQILFELDEDQIMTVFARLSFLNESIPLLHKLVIEIIKAHSEKVEDE